jgi:hypothetical protein
MTPVPYIRYMLLVPLLAAGGCILPVGPEDVRFQVSASSGVGITQKLGISVDGLTINLVSALAPTAIPLPMHHISWADVGIYEVHTRDSDQLPRSVLKRVRMIGWEPMVRTRDGSSETAIFVRYFGSAITGMCVLARDGRELVIARISGRIDNLIADMFGEKGWGGFYEIGGQEAPAVIDVPTEARDKDAPEVIQPPGEA